MFEKLDSIIEFLFVTVIAKAIIGHWIAQRLVALAKKWFGTSERKTAIWQHYQNRARGSGHVSGDVLTCSQDKCAVFSAV